MTDIKQVILSVKAGANIHRAYVHELRGVVEREGAEIGVLITMENPTKPMREEAASAGFYQSPWGTHAYSAPSRTLIPLQAEHRFRRQAEHRFRSKPNTDSAGKPNTFRALQRNR